MKGSATILIVEDSPTQAEYLSAILEDRGFQVVTTRNGEEALASMAKRRPDLVISDVTMPGIDGFELCSRIAHDPSLGKIPVILLTGLSHPADVFKGLESGASQFVTKPFEDDYLLSRVEYVLANAELRRQSGAELGIAVSFGGSRHFLTAERIQVIDLLLTSFAATVEKNLELEQLNRELRAVRHELAQKNQELQALALHDELTGLHNRRGFNLLAELQIKVARRATGGALLFLDLDGFKHVNDTLGHDAGDELLRATGAILTSTFREMDVIGRIGGDEFAVLFPCLLPDGVMAVLYRLEQNLARYRAESELAQKLSVSIGTATFDPTDEVSLADLLKRADEDMYSTRNAKNGGSKPRAQRAPQGPGASQGEIR